MYKNGVSEENESLIKKCHYETPIGMVCIEECEQSIVGLYLEDQYDQKKEQTTPLLEETKKQLQEYFEKKRTEFHIPIRLQGTEFQKKVWNALRQIPYGRTCSYGEIAKRIGQPTASRAVGGANNKNHILILVPCYRVIGADGKLVGFGAGIPIKRYLLELER